MMADVGHEPSMEDILSSIKKIISDDSDKTLSVPRRTRVDLRTIEVEPKADPIAQSPDDDDDIFELNDAMPPVEAEMPEAPMIAAPLMSPVAEAASRSAFDALQSVAPKSTAPASGTTIDDLARELLRPMLKEWLDAHLPGIVEGVVAKEVARISGRPL